eukprot:scaffold296580_cov22-Tisochrysis_lutea.AAC.2
MAVQKKQAKKPRTDGKGAKKGGDDDMDMDEVCLQSYLGAESAWSSLCCELRKPSTHEEVIWLICQSKGGHAASYQCTERGPALVDADLKEAMQPVKKESHLTCFALAIVLGSGATMQKLATSQHSCMLAREPTDTPS